MVTGGGVDETDVLVIRVWHEAESERPFRARITYGSDQQTTTSDPDALVEFVRRWVEARTGPSDSRVDAG